MSRAIHEEHHTNVLVHCSPLGVWMQRVVVPLCFCWPCKRHKPAVSSVKALEPYICITEMQILLTFEIMFEM